MSRKIWKALLLCVGLSVSSGAWGIPIIFDITLESAAGDGAGTIIIDDSLISPNAAVFTGNAITSINFLGLVFDTPFSPTTEQFIFDGFGQEIVGVNDTNGVFVDFEDSNGNFLFVELDEGSVPGTFTTLGLNGASGTFDIVSRAVPEPSVLFLLGVGLLGFSVARRKRQA